MYPRLLIDLDKLAHNAKSLAEFCGSSGITVSAVTKVFCADTKMVDTLLKQPVSFLADSRLENIESYPKDIKVRSMLLRLSSPSEAERVVKSCDISLNSELSTIKKLGEAAKSAGVNHSIILMVDLGDLREGIYHTNEVLLLETAKFIQEHSNLELEGVGVNLTCYGSVLPTTENMQKLCEIAKKFDVKIVSGGNSSSLLLLKDGKMPKEINNLRLGESVVLGLETVLGEPFMNLKQDVVTLEAEIIELMDKPSMPEGELGMNAFGEKPVYEDRGIRKRAILSIGRQDTVCDGLTCTDPGVEVVGASSDHLIVDVTDATNRLVVGDTLTFSLSYGAILAAFTSKYVKRKYIGG